MLNILFKGDNKVQFSICECIKYEDIWFIITELYRNYI